MTDGTCVLEQPLRWQHKCREADGLCRQLKVWLIKSALICALTSAALSHDDPMLKRFSQPTLWHRRHAAGNKRLLRFLLRRWLMSRVAVGLEAKPHHHIVSLACRCAGAARIDHSFYGHLAALGAEDPSFYSAADSVVILGPPPTTTTFPTLQPLPPSPLFN